MKTVHPPTNTVCGGYNDHFRSNTDPCYIQNRTCYKEVEVFMYLYIAFNFACTVDVFASVLISIFNHLKFDVIFRSHLRKFQ